MIKQIIAIVFSVCFILNGCSKNNSYLNNDSPLLWDLPQNEGVSNVLKNADQLISMSYTPVSNFNICYGDMSPNSLTTGMPYSSTREEDLFCPNNVSLWTFYSSLTNPNAYIYTKNLKNPPHSLTGLIGPYYGQVCTSFVQYALGIKYNFQIYQMTIWEGIENIESKEIDSLKLGDILTTQKGHTILITGIERKGDYITNVEISEGVPNFARKHKQNRDYVSKLLSQEGYEIHRYKYIAETQHTPSPLINTESSLLLSNQRGFNKYIMPRRGDKANWRKDENILIDILDRGNFSKYKVYKNGDLVINNILPINNSYINLGVLPYGEYKMCLSNEASDSDYVYWMVVDYSISATIVQEGRVKVTFSSANATPIWITWRRPNIPNTHYNNMPLWTDVIYAGDILNGYRISNLEKWFLEKYGAENWDIKVAFETPYGIITSDAAPLYNINSRR